MADVEASLARSTGWYFDHDRVDDPELDRLIDDDLVRRYAIAGTPDECVALTRDVLALGFDGASMNLAAPRREFDVRGPARETLELSAGVLGRAALTPTASASAYSRAMTADERLTELGIELPTRSAPAGTYVPAVRTGNLVFLSGAGPTRADGSTVTGKVGSDLDIDAAKAAARLVGLQLLASLRDELGSLDRRDAW